MCLCRAGISAVSYSHMQQCNLDGACTVTTVRPLSGMQNPPRIASSRCLAAPSLVAKTVLHFGHAFVLVAIAAKLL